MNVCVIDREEARPSEGHLKNLNFFEFDNEATDSHHKTKNNTQYISSPPPPINDPSHKKPESSDTITRSSLTKKILKFSPIALVIFTALFITIENETPPQAITVMGSDGKGYPPPEVNIKEPSWIEILLSKLEYA